MNGPKSVKMTPLARRVAADQNLDTHGVSGSGYAGKVYAKDLRNAYKAFDAETGWPKETGWKIENERTAGRGQPDVYMQEKLEWPDKRDQAAGHGQTAADGFVMPGFLFDPPPGQDMAPIGVPPLGRLIEFPKSPSFRFEDDMHAKDRFEQPSYVQSAPGTPGPLPGRASLSNDTGNKAEILAREALLAAVKDASDEFLRRLKEILENVK